jgi:uncharacterized tellurite resistance protein B-like protein
MNIRQESILHLTYLLVYSDGEFDESEKRAIKYICDKEGISDNEYQEFIINAQDLSEKELFNRGLDILEESSEEDKISTFVWLYKLSEADGMVHAKEVRFLLYSLRRANLDLDDVKKAAEGVPAIPV